MDIKFNLKKHLIKQTFWAYLFSYIAAPFGLFIKILYAKNLTLEDFGLFYMILGFFGLISIFNDLGFTETLSYYGVKFYEKKDYKSLKLSFYYAIFMQLGTAIIISVIILLLSNFLSLHWFKNPKAEMMINLMTIYFISMNTLRPIITLFLIKLNLFWNKIFNALYLIGIFTLSYLLFHYSNLPHNLISVISWDIIFLILTIFYFIIVQIKFQKEFQNNKITFDLQLYKKLWKYAIPVVIGSGASLLLGQIDLQMIGIFTNTTNVGYYSIALSIINILGILLNPILGILFPLTTSLITKNKKKELSQLLSLIYRVFLFMLLPILTVFLNYSKTIYSILFNTSKFYSQNLFVSLLIFGFLSIFYGINFQILAGLGLVKERNKIMYIIGFLNIILNYILLKIFGFVGIAYSTAIVSIIFWILSYVLVFKQEIHIKINKFCQIVLNGIIFYYLINFFKEIIVFKNFYINSIFILGISFGIYLISGWILRIYTIKEIKKLVWTK